MWCHHYLGGLLHLQPRGFTHNVTMGSCKPPGNVASQELHILLVGPRRTGKSSTGNTLLGQDQVFATRGGGASTAASAITAGHHVSVVDAQGWGLSEEFVPPEEKTELLRALSLCGPGGPHVVLLVIPLLDFTEPEGRAVERRMEVLTSTVWRHTMVLFTCGDRLRARGRSVEEHIQSGGPALNRLMKKCRYRYHVFDNKTVVIGKRERGKQEVKEGGKKQEKTWHRKTDKGVGRKSTGGEADGRKEGEQKQVRELLSKVENMLQENRGWHFSLHMYQRLEEEGRAQELRVRLDAETSVGSSRRKQKTETKINMEPEQEQRFETEEEEKQEDSLRKEQENKEDSVERKMNSGKEQKKRAKIELKNLCSEKDGWETSSDCGGELEDSTGVNSGMMAPCCPNGGQSIAFSPIRRLA